jgi:hypothetical protein
MQDEDVSGFTSTLRGGELHHKLVLYTEPFHEMEEIPTVPTPFECAQSLRIDPEDRQIVTFSVKKAPSKREINGNIAFTAVELRDKRKAFTKCEVCGKELKERYRFGDHNHITGKLRGILCPKHNQMLGAIEELKRNPTLAESFEAYLKKYE